ncbi:hypothetical protein NKR23_g3818 [Pleurostoma richardsiae]|uniref:HIG1 domain-containing protein n=1 Tax=Pleurostoma richardsiae TaxID=41990 RepID=A0AA38RYG2_9PEZI|nr:hypothetical protein NKR23_g3818 [Pleurostoma richardsiae]
MPSSIPEQPLSGRPLPSSFDENEDFYNDSGFNKVMRRLKQEPLIPLGCLLTVAAFTNAYRAMRRGDHNQVQRMFRARVLAQGFTVAAMVAGGLYFGAERHKERELWKLQEAQSAEEKRQKWIKELEARDEEEKALREKLERRRKKASDNAAREAFQDAVRKAEVEGEAVADQAKETGEKAKAPGSGLLGRWFAGESTKVEDETKSPESATSGK